MHVFFFKQTKLKEVKNKEEEEKCSFEMLSFDDEFKIIFSDG